MIYVQTLLKIIDNTGGFTALCVKILSGRKRGYPGDEIVLAVKSILLNRKIVYKVRRKVLKGTVRRAVILRTCYMLKRWGNIRIKCFTSGAALIGRWEMPLGTRVHGPVLFESRVSKFIRISMLSEGSL